MMDETQIVEQDIKTIYLGNLRTVEWDLALPSRGTYGSQIRWVSSDERVLDSTGKVTRPSAQAGDRTVRLTGIFTCGEVQKEKDYQVTVLARPDSRPGQMHRIKLEKPGTVQPVQECGGMVRLLPESRFYEAQERMHRYLLGVDNSQMLYHFRKACGLDTEGAASLGGWDAPDCRLKGHTTGHYLSALALCFRATGDVKIRKKAEEMVRELGRCQTAFAHMPGIKPGFLFSGSEEQFDLLEQYTPYPRIWAPYYTYHKIMAGLLDCFLYAGCGRALDIAEAMGMWTWNRLKRLPSGQLEKMWSMYIAGEFGGMNAVLAELGRLTGRKEFTACARLFDNRKLFDGLAQGYDCLSGLHANQHIPQIQGAVALYRATGEERYLRIAEVFWKTVTENRSYATGGTGETEMFHGFRQIGSLLTGNTQETCASYNMLKLTRDLFQLNPDAGYMDYYERTVLNHILATPARDDSGESVYFLPLAPGMKREFLHENSCCHGTGMENHFRYREGIYFQNEAGTVLYINLYLPSRLSDPEDGLDARIEIRSRRQQKYRIQIKGERLREVRLRKPEWAGAFHITADGVPLDAVTDEKGYIHITGSFIQGKSLEAEWKPEFRLLRTWDRPERTAVQYGPYILAALSDRKDFLQMPFREEDVASRMQWEGDPKEDRIRFRCCGYEWIPLCEIDEQSYHVYVISSQESEDE